MTEYGRCPAFGYECEYVSIVNDVERASEVMEQAKIKVEAQAAEIERLRGLVAKLYCAAGCSCCRDDTAWEAASDELAEGFNIPKYEDGSGYDWYSVRDQYAQDDAHD
jgi:hypothetical protein